MLKMYFSSNSPKRGFHPLTIVLVLGLAILASVQNVYAQGCSDAGFCTIDGLKPANADSSETPNNQFKIGTFYGKADHAITVYGLYVEYNRKINDQWGVDFKLTTLGQNGNNISAFGVSDAFINVKYKASDNLKLIGGVKIPLMIANKEENGLPLPMDYQASLGTFDLILGVGYKLKKLQIVAAVQQPLTQNSNRFFNGAYPADSELKKFQSTNKFQRSGDVLLRLSYPLELTKKLKLTPSVLPIYHLANDKYTDEFDIVKEIEGSNGLTLNGNIYLDYALNKSSFLQLNMGAPFITRKSRPDGLTRSYIFNLEYKLLF